MQLILRDLKTVGIDVKLNQKEYGAFISSTAARHARWRSGVRLREPNLTPPAG